MSHLSLSGTSLHFSDSFVISCGTVTVDRVAKKVLLIRHRGTGEVYLPKGRKDTAETLEDAAIRETLEESGFRTKLLAHKLPTLATMPISARSVDADLCASETPLTTEPVAMAQRITAGVLKIIFWYAAEADSASTKEENTQQAGEDFDTLWVSMSDAAQSLTFEDDRKVVVKVITAL